MWRRRNVKNAPATVKNVYRRNHQTRQPQLRKNSFPPQSDGLQNTTKACLTTKQAFVALQRSLFRDKTKPHSRRKQALLASKKALPRATASTHRQPTITHNVYYQRITLNSENIHKTHSFVFGMEKQHSQRF